MIGSFTALPITKFELESPSFDPLSLPPILQLPPIGPPLSFLPPYIKRKEEYGKVKGSEKIIEVVIQIRRSVSSLFIIITIVVGNKLNICYWCC